MLVSSFRGDSSQTPAFTMRSQAVKLYTVIAFEEYQLNTMTCVTRCCLALVEIWEAVFESVSVSDMPRKGMGNDLTAT